MRRLLALDFVGFVPAYALTWALVILIMFSQMGMRIIARPAAQQIAWFRKYLGL